MNYNAKYRRERTLAERVLTVVGLVLCVVFVLMLISIVTIIVISAFAPDTLPSVWGITPLVALSDSMSGEAEGHIESGDLIFVGRMEASELRKGDVMVFMQSGVVVTHRIIDITVDDAGRRTFTTKGDANNTTDDLPVTEDSLVGIYKSRIPGMGDFALFLQTPLDMVIFIGIPEKVITCFVCSMRGGGHTPAKHGYNF